MCWRPFIPALRSHSAPTGDGKICEQNCEHFNAFFNHAAQPNVLQMTERFTGSHVVLIAKTKIEKGEELTVNYDCSVGYERYGHEPMMQWFLGLCSNHGVEKRPSSLTMMPIKVDLSGGPTQLEPSISGSIVFLYSSHFEASRQFYEHHLCLPVRSDKGAVVFYSLPGIASHLGVVKQGLSAADIPPCSAAQAGRDTVMLCLLSDDISGWHAKLLEHGYAFDQEPQRTERFGIFNALLRDPDGYLIELQQFLDDAEQAEFCNS